MRSPKLSKLHGDGSRFYVAINRVQNDYSILPDYWGIDGGTIDGVFMERSDGGEQIVDAGATGTVKDVTLVNRGGDQTVRAGRGEGKIALFNDSASDASDASLDSTEEESEHHFGSDWKAGF